VTVDPRAADLPCVWKAQTLRHHLVTLAGGAFAALLTLTVVAGTLRGLWVVVAAAGSVLAGAVFAVQVDTWRRTRSLRKFVRDELRRGVGDRDVTSQAPPVTRADVEGAVRVMQAQYTGRLDRMQAALDKALDEVVSSRSRPQQ
jgi:hypothetical protein